MVRKAYLIVAAFLLVLFVAVPVAAKTQVNFWLAGNAQEFMDVINKELLPSFEKANPDIDLKVTFVPWSDLSVKLTTAFAGGVGPDIFMHGSAATAGFASANRIEPLDKYIATIPDAKDFGTTLDDGLYFGKRYLVPMFGAGRLLIYRADQFKEAGLDPDRPPTTWEELRDAAVKLTVRKGNRLIREGIDIPASGIDAEQIWSLFLWQNGGDFFNKDYTKATFNDAKGVEALQFLVDLIQEYKVADTSINEGQGNIPPIASDKIAMLFAVPGDLTQIKSYSPDIYKEVRVAMPLTRSAQRTFYSFAGMFMSKDSKHKDEAWKVIQFFSSKEALEKINSAMSTLPPRRSLGSAGFIAKDPNLKAFVEGMEYAKGNPNIPEWVKARDIISRYIEKALFGQISAKEALDKAADEVNALLAKR